MKIISVKCAPVSAPLKKKTFMGLSPTLTGKLQCNASLTILPRRFFTRSGLSFEYGPSLAFAKNTAVLQSTATLTKCPPENTGLLLSEISKDPPLSRTEGADP